MSSRRPPSSPAQRRALARRRAAAKRRLGLLRLAVLLGLLTVTGVVVSSQVGGGVRRDPRAAGGRPGSETAALRRTLPAVEAGLLPWRLTEPLSRSVVFPAVGGQSLLVAGGLSATDSSQATTFLVDPVTGRLSGSGRLATATHDAAGVALGGRGVVFGGGVSAPAAFSQSVSRLGKSDVKGTPLSPLPGPRADAAAVSIGRTAYVVGGYGAHSDRAVLSTSDGRSYHKVANLPVPVRYPAVTTWRGNIYVFGGETVYGPRPGVASRAVQVVDPASHSATLAGRLPVAVEGAAAATLDGVMYLAGGQSPSGTAAGSHGELSSIYAWSPQRRRALLAGHLFLPVSHAGLAVLGSRAWLIGGETAPGAPTSAVQMFEPNSRFGTAGKPGAGSPYYGDKLMIADRGNNRLLVLDDTGRIIWKYPSPGRPAPPGGFYFPDDAFFADHGRQIISNQEENDTLVRLGYPSGKVLWTYGHPRQPGSRPGYLDNPDDAYLLKNGDVTVADPMNCRVLVLSKRSKILTQIGTPGMCLHEAGRYLGSPNGDTPLSDGDLLVSEINGAWIDEYTLRGHLVWAVKLPIAYPSDPQPISRNKFLVADYEHPGLFLEFNRSGKILYRYGPTSGPGELNRPSLVERLPSGVLMANDDYNDRMMAIDPATGALVWQYGKTERPGTAYGFLNQPDGFDLLGPNRTYPTHPATG